MTYTNYITNVKGYIQALFEDVVFLPEIESFFFSLYEIQTW